jgi:hypothetical protein
VGSAKSLSNMTTGGSGSTANEGAGNKQMLKQVIKNPLPNINDPAPN